MGRQLVLQDDDEMVCEQKNRCNVSVNQGCFFAINNGLSNMWGEGERSNDSYRVTKIKENNRGKGGSGR